MTRSREDAEDLLQESLLHAFQHFGQLRTESRVLPWARTIVRNTVRMSRRRGMWEPAAVESIDDHYPELTSTSSPLELVAAQETKQAVLRHIPELTSYMRRTFELRVLEGRTTDETAALLGITRFAVRTRLRRARQTLRRLCGKT